MGWFNLAIQIEHPFPRHESIIGIFYFFSHVAWIFHLFHSSLVYSYDLLPLVHYMPVTWSSLSRAKCEGWHFCSSDFELQSATFLSNCHLLQNVTLFMTRKGLLGFFFCLGKASQVLFPYLKNNFLDVDLYETLEILTPLCIWKMGWIL